MLDTKALLAWNGEMAVLSFRGTNSLRNACSDLQVFMLAHPPKRGMWTMGAPSPQRALGGLHALSALEHLLLLHSQLTLHVELC